jgi:hypothetical protein
MEWARSGSRSRYEGDCHDNHLSRAPLPAGAHTLSVVWTADRCVDDYHAAVRGAAIQMPDGHIDDGTLQSDPPGLEIEIAAAVNMTTDQARQFAAMIIETADQVDGWVAR